MVHYLLISESVMEKRKKNKQTTLNIFLKRVTPPQEPQAGPSEGIPEEGILIIGDDSSMPDIVPEDLPVE